MKKKWIFLFLVTIFSVSLIFAGCKKKEDESSSSSSIDTMPSDTEAELSLNTSTIENLTIGDSIVINADYTVKGEETLTWKSSDENVVTVNSLDAKNCNVTAVNLGTATITATYGELVATCTITTATNGIYPVLEFKNISETEEGINKLPNDKLDLSAYVNFNGKYYEDMQISYSLADPSFGTIDQETGIVTLSDKLGSTTITATASWRGIPSELLQKTLQINVTVPSVYEVTDMNGNALSVIDLYTVSEFEGTPLKNEETITISIAEDNVQIFDYTVEIVDHMAGDNSDKEVASWDGTSGKIVAKTYGEAKLLISYISATGKTVNRHYPIIVNCPQGEYQTVEYFSTMKGILPVEDIFSVGEKKVFRATQDGRELTVNGDGTALTDVVSTTLTEMSKETVIVYNDLVSYVIPLETYKMVIENEADYLAIFNTQEQVNAEGKTSYLDTVAAGYYFLKNDIIIEQWEKRADGKTARNHRNLSFNGIFDGNGKTLKTKPLLGGTFGSLKGTVKNLNLDYDVVMDIGGRETGKARGMLAQDGASAVIENVNVRVLGESGIIDKTISMFGEASGYASLKNIVIDYSDTVSEELEAFVDNSYWGLLFHYGKNTNTQNVYVISSTMKYLTVYPKEKHEYYTVAENDTNITYPNLTKNVQVGVQRFDTWQALAQAENDLSAFDSKLWDTEDGIPVWKSIKGEYVISYVNGIESNEILLNSITETSSVLTLSYGLENIACSLTFKDDTTSLIATIDGNTITSIRNAFGSGTVVASYQLNGVSYEKEFTLTVYLGEDETDTTVYTSWIGDNLMWSTAETAITIPAEMSQHGEIVMIYNETDGVTVYFDEIWMADTLANTTNELIIKDIRVKFKDGTGYKATIDCVTQAISDGTELNNLLIACSSSNATTIEGYYILEADCVVNTPNNHNGLTFAGTFDGKGHTIALSDPSGTGAGLFGTLTGTVKNLALTYDLTKDYGNATYDNRNALLAKGGNGGVVDNLYVKLNGTTGLLKTTFSVFGSCYSGFNYSSISNVVIDCGDVISETMTDNVYGLMFHEGTPTYVTDVYVISSGLKYTSSKTGDKYVAYAENDDELKNAYNVEGFTAKTQTGVKRYDTWAILIEKEQDNAFNSFNSKYWDTTNGAPLWHAIADDFFVVEWAGDNLVWSTNEAQLTVPEAMGTLADVAEIYNETNGISIYDGATWTTDTLNNTTNELVSKDIRIKFKNGTTYLASIDCVTQAISDATELESVLPASGTVTGYYILDKDVPVSAWTIANHSSLKFSGVLDGQGYTISAPQILGGLFGNFGGTIKNVDIQITKVLTSGIYSYTGPSVGIISNHIAGTATVENVNVKLCDETNKITVTFSTFGYMDYATTKLNLKNVVIDCGDVVNETLTATNYSGLLVHWGNCAGKVDAANVYFISSTHKYLSADSTNKTNCYVAANDTTLQHPTLTTTTLTGVYRYDSWDGVAADVLNALGNDYWAVVNGELVWNN